MPSTNAKLHPTAASMAPCPSGTAACAGLISAKVVQAPAATSVVASKARLTPRRAVCRQVNAANNNNNTTTVASAPPATCPTCTNRLSKAARSGAMSRHCGAAFAVALAATAAALPAVAPAAPGCVQPLASNKPICAERWALPATGPVHQLGVMAATIINAMATSASPTPIKREPMTSRLTRRAVKLIAAPVEHSRNARYGEDLQCRR